MKDVRFYLEFPTITAKRKSGRENKGHSGTVFAAFVDQTSYRSAGGYMQEGLSSVSALPNSGVAGTSASRDYLRQCKRIPERLARQIHPRLFERLDVKD